MTIFVDISRQNVFDEEKIKYLLKLPINQFHL